MRHALAIAIVLLITVAAEARSLSSQECADAAAGMTKGAAAMKHLATSVLPTTSNNLGVDGAGELKKAAARFDAAREKAIPAVKDLANAMEDLAYQLRVCAR